MAGSIDDAMAALQRTEANFTRLLRSGLDGTRRVEGLSWTIRDLAAHLASGTVAYRQVAEGDPSPYEALERRAETNQKRLEAESSQDLEAMADRIDAEASRMLAALRSREGDNAVSWHGGKSLPLPAFLGAAVGEFMIHGRDLARTVGQRWPIERRDALPVVDFFNAVTPYVVDEESSKGVTATFEVRFRGYETTTFVFDNGSFSMKPGPADRADVRLSVDPVSFVLIGYRRVGLAVPIFTGRAVAWGRRPWLALRFPGLFQSP